MQNCYFPLQVHSWLCKPHWGRHQRWWSHHSYPQGELVEPRGRQVIIFGCIGAPAEKCESTDHLQWCSTHVQLGSNFYSPQCLFFSSSLLHSFDFAQETWNYYICTLQLKKWDSSCQNLVIFRRHLVIPIFWTVQLNFCSCQYGGSYFYHGASITLHVPLSISLSLLTTSFKVHTWISFDETQSQWQRL